MARSDKKVGYPEPESGIGTDPKKPKDANPYAKEVGEKFSRAQQSIMEELQNYWLNFLFLEGHQWLFYNDATSQINEIPRAEEDVTRLTLNRMRSSSRTIMSKLTQRDLTFEVMPSDADDATMRGARIAQSLLANLRIAQSWEQKREIADWSTWKGGTAALCVDWDPEASDLAADPTDTGNRVVRKGDVCITPLNLSEFVVEPGARDGERARWWIKSLLLPPAEVQDLYGLEWTPAADATANLTPFQVQAMQRNQMIQTPLTRVLTYYERPNKKCPKGKICVVVNDQVVSEKDEWPFPWRDHLNIAIQKETPVETRWTGDTVLSDSRGVQVAFNHAHSVIDEHMKRAANARMAVPISGLDYMDDLTDQPAEVVAYPDGSAPPSWIGAPQMPQWWNERPQVLAQEMDDILGVHQVSRGDAPVNVESGYGLSILAEHDSTPIMRMSKEQAIAWSKVATMTLKLYEKMVKHKRKTSANVPGQGSISLEWSGDDFKGQTTATVPYDEIVPRSRAAQLQFAKDMLQMGVVTSAADFASVADLPGQETFLGALSPDIAKARRENHMFSLGRPAVPAEFDDHEGHVMEHNRWRKSIDYEIASPEIQQHVETHIQAHITMAAEAAGGQSAAAAIGGTALASVPTQAGAPPMDPAMLAQEQAAMAAPSPEMTAPADGGTATGALDIGAMTEAMLAELDAIAAEGPNPEEG